MTEPVSTNSKLHSSDVRSDHLLDRHRSHLLIVDIQTKLLPLITNSEALEETTIFLMNAAEVLSVPVFVSEQYPKGLGVTVSSITDHTVPKQVAEKLRFSASECFLNGRAPGRNSTVINSTGADPVIINGRDQVVIVGIEAHICVLQTVLDLIYAGLKVYVVADAVGSRTQADYALALQRVRDAGAVVCSAESVAFEWCEVAGTDEFRQISWLVRDRDST